jgi:hypothetical protein
MSDKEVRKRVSELLNRPRAQRSKAERAELKKLLMENQGGAPRKALVQHMMRHVRRKRAKIQRCVDRAKNIEAARAAATGSVGEMFAFVIEALEREGIRLAFPDDAPHSPNRRPPMPPRGGRPRKLPPNVIPFRRPVKKLAQGDGPKAA